MRYQLLVIAKAPVPGTVKTRLCPPCTPEQAAVVAAAALSDTLTIAGHAPAVHRTIVLSGDYGAPEGWRISPQRGDSLSERLVHAFTDTALPGVATVLIGMDTPQVTVDSLSTVTTLLGHADGVLAPARDGGWWALALRDPTRAVAIRAVVTSRVDTCARTAEALRTAGCTVVEGPSLRDVDTVADAWAVAKECPGGRFAAAVRENIPVEVIA